MIASVASQFGGSHVLLDSIRFIAQQQKLFSIPPHPISFFFRHFLILTSCLWATSQGLSSAKLFYLFGTNRAFGLGNMWCLDTELLTHPNHSNVIWRVLLVWVNVWWMRLEQETRKRAAGMNEKTQLEAKVFPLLLKACFPWKRTVMFSVFCG